MTSSSDSAPTSPSIRLNEAESLQRLVREQQEAIRANQEIIQAQQQTIQALHQTIEKMEHQMKHQQERIEQLEAEVRELKKLKGRPKLKASLLNKEKAESGEDGKRPGSSKRSKKLKFEIDEERIIQPDVIPANTKFNGYRNYDVQELKIKRHNIRFRLAEYVNGDGSTIVGQLPSEYLNNGHYGPTLLGYVLYQHYQCRTPHPLIVEQLQEWGIEISSGQLNNILIENKEIFHSEQQQVLRVGLETAAYVHTDDTGARHQGKNGYCTVIGNQWFAYFKSSCSKSRQNFLETLQGETLSYVLNDDAQSYLESQPLAAKYRERLTFSDAILAQDSQTWAAYLLEKGIVSAKAIRSISEAALLGGAMSGGINPLLRILSDGAGQFNVLIHGLCWVHAERCLRRLQGNTEYQRQNIAQMQDLLWQYYPKLQAYRQHPTNEGKTKLFLEFDQIFERNYLHHASLNIVLKWFRTHKAELLRVLDYAQFPLHNNDAETDIREFVIRRKISGGTRSDAGRYARDTFVGLKKTCRKLGVSFWQYLLSRIRGDGKIPPLSDILRTKATAPEQVSLAT
jgi:Transposase IS66 family